MENKHSNDKLSRIDWLRSSSDMELIKALYICNNLNVGLGCAYCKDEENNKSCQKGCCEGVIRWWRTNVSKEQFRREFKIEEDNS